MSETQYYIRKPEKCDYGRILEFIEQDFLPRECLSVVSGRYDTSITGAQDTNSSKSDDRFLSWLEDGVSLIALDKKDETLAGIAVNFVAKKSDHEIEEDEDVVKMPRYLSNILKFIKELEEGHSPFEELGVEQGMDLRFLGVKEKYAGQGIARKLTEATIELAKELKLPFVQSIPTSPATIHLFESLGFKTKSEIKCKGYLSNDGSPCFPLAGETDRSRFVVKVL